MTARMLRFFLLIIVSFLLLGCFDFDVKVTLQGGKWRRAKLELGYSLGEELRNWLDPEDGRLVNLPFPLTKEDFAAVVAASSQQVTISRYRQRDNRVDVEFSFADNAALLAFLNDNFPWQWQLSEGKLQVILPVQPLNADLLAITDGFFTLDIRGPETIDSAVLLAGTAVAAGEPATRISRVGKKVSYRESLLNLLTDGFNLQLSW